MVVRTPKPVRHGTRAAYFYRRCRCPRCREANNRYQRARRRKGIPQIVSAAPARAHIIMLRQAGMGRRTVARLAEIDPRTVFAIGSGKRLSCTLTTERVILNVRPDSPADGAYVNSKAALDQLAHMLKPEIGFNKKLLASRLGSQAKVPSLQIRASKVRYKTVKKVARLYEMVK